MNPAMAFPSSPRFEQHHDGFGINHSSPRISWSFLYDSAGPLENWNQIAYQLDINGRVYHVQSQESILVPWPAAPLRSREIAHVAVRCLGRYQNGDGEGCVKEEWTCWSVISAVEAGLLDREDWKASMISTHDSLHADDGSLHPICFRKVFSIKETVEELRRARLYLTAHGIYEVKINGVVVGNHLMAPGWTSYKHRTCYQVHDVATQLKQGLNVVSVEVGPGWYASALGWCGGRRCFYGDKLGVLLQLEIEIENQRHCIISDDTWNYSRSSILRSEAYNGEKLCLDTAEKLKGWDKDPSFDDNTWTSAALTNLSSVRLVCSNGPPVRVTQTVAPVNIFKSSSGKTLIDFGQNLVGRLKIHKLKKSAGKVVRFRHAEVLENGELGTRPLREAKNTDEIHFANDNTLTNWSPKFTFHGFRYVQVEGWDVEDVETPLKITALAAEVMHSDLRRTGHFSCSHKHLNKLHENAIWSMRGNFLSIPTDCPARDERLGWTGDIQVFAPSAAFLYDISAMLSDWLEDLRDEQCEDGRNGVVPLVVPSVIEREDIDKEDHWWPSAPQAIWGDASILVPWDLYRACGDAQILHKQYFSMLTWLENGVIRCSDGLWDEDQWQLGDWLDPNAPPQDAGDGRTDGTLVADAYLVQATRVFTEICRLLEKEIPSNPHIDYIRLKAAFQDKYVTKGGLLVGDTQTALSLAVVFDLLDLPEHKIATASRLARLVRKAQFKVSTGFAGTPIICHALTLTQQPQLAYRMIQNKDLPSWMYPIEMGATTMWERWDSMLPNGTINPGEMTSFNHYALGSVIHWLHEYVGGLSPMDPGWKRIKVEPIPGGTVTSAEIEYQSPYGLVSCSWTLDAAVFNMYLTIPPNCSAVVILPGCRNSTSECRVGEKLVGSGHYQFSCPFEPDEWPPKAIKAPFWDQAQPRYI